MAADRIAALPQIKMQEEDASELGHRLELKDAGHERLLREVALEEGLIHADVLHRDGAAEAAVAVGSGLNSLPEMAQALAAASAVEPAEELEESEPAAERKVTVRDNDKGPKDPTAITVINKLPPTVVSILKHQFRLMNRWLEPIHRESEAQSEKLSAVETQIKECLKRYEKLIGSVEKRKRKK